MSELSLSHIQVQDCDEVEAFEFANRAFFESHINARPDAFYAPGGVSAAVHAAIEAARSGSGYQFLLRGRTGELVARVNLSRVRREHFHSAELGYRVGELQGGRGYATEAVRLALEYAFAVARLRRVEATATPGNAASVKVLQRNGFTQFGRSTRSFQLAGTWHDLLHFERHRA
jgi:ribosomal-protein-alanine N-acetyltransferase